MPRVGRHPFKNKEIKNLPVVHQRITVTTICYIPMLGGYWQESLNVLKLFFTSLRANTGQPYDLMVFDNGSCEEVKNYLLELQADGQIQYLVFSTQNLRKLGALNYLLSAAPGELIAYADSDVYFLPGWLDESIKILETFPEAGKVTALPIVGGDTTEISKSVFQQAIQDSTILTQTGYMVPDLYVQTHRISLGADEQSYQSRLINRKDTLLQRNGVQALLSGADFQFLITAQAARTALPLQVQNPGEYFDPIYSPVLENRLDSAGIWQLSTPGYFIHHMGNRVPDFKTELPWLQIDINQVTGSEPKVHKKAASSFRLLKYLRANRFVRRLFTKVHLWSYRFLYDS